MLSVTARRPHDALQHLHESAANRSPLVVAGFLGCCCTIISAQFFIAKKHYDCLRKPRDVVGYEDISTMVHVQSFSTHRGGNNRFGHSHRLIDLQPRSTADSERDRKSVV